MSLPKIGILGGMGPAATILLQQRLVDALDAESDGDHIPLLIDMNPQVPSRIDYFLHGSQHSPGPVLVQMARHLERSGASALAMPCCTAHHFAAEVARSVSVPFLNMVELAAARLSGAVDTGQRIGVLASPANDKNALFENAFHPHGLTAQFPARSDRLLSTIEVIKSDGPLDEHVATVQKETDSLVDAGVSGVVIGCTEFSLIAHRLVTAVPVVDALDALVDGIVDHARQTPPQDMPCPHPSIRNSA